MLPPIPMLTTKKRAQILLIFSVGFIAMASLNGCAPAGARALAKGDELIKKGNYAEAVKKFEEAKTAFPNSAKVWNHLGLGYQYAGDVKKAVQAYQQALLLDRNLAPASYNLGSLHLEQHNFSAAITELTTFTSLDSKNPEGWFKLGDAYTQLASQVSSTEKYRLLDAARKNLETAQKLQPSAETLNALGMIQIQRGRPRDAIPSFTAALQLEPGYAPALLNLAIVNHQYLHERQRALMNYRQYLNVAKNSPEAAPVQILVRQLENELNPPALVTNRPVAAIANKPQAATNVPTPTRTETTPPRTAVAPRTAPVLSAPKAEPLVKREAPIEVVRTPDQTPVKRAQDASAPAPKSTLSSGTVVFTSQTRAPDLVEKDSGVLTKLNPSNWFKKKPKRVTTTDLPVIRPTTEPGGNAATTESNSAARDAATSPIPRYRYRPLNEPAEGNRAEAVPFFAQAVKAQREHRLAAAIADYRQAVKLAPSFFEANYNLALAFRESRDLPSTLQTYEQALAIRPDSVNARYSFAFTLQEAGYFQDAANELEKILAQNPNETRAHLLLGNLCAQRLDQVAAAREHYRKVLAVEPQHPQATQIRYWLAAHP